MALVVKFAASLVAILALAWMARRLGLGRAVSIQDEEHAQGLADEVACGFEAQKIVVDAKGRAALLCNSAGQIILVKQHGAQFSGRLLGSGANAVIRVYLDESELEVDTGERLFGKASLIIAEPERWVKTINAGKEITYA